MEKLEMLKNISKVVSFWVQTLVKHINFNDSSSRISIANCDYFFFFHKRDVRPEREQNRVLALEILYKEFHFFTINLITASQSNVPGQTSNES